MLFEDHRDVDYVYKLIRIPSKVYIRSIRKYK